jgi:hypothetical protein
MPVARYFLFVGGVLIALLFAINAILPPEAAVHSAPGIDRSTVRIRSDQKLPERVVYDTSQPSIVLPAANVEIAATPAAVPAPGISAQTRVRETFAQFVPAGSTKAEQSVAKPEQVAKAEPAAAPKKRRIAKVHAAPRAGYPQMRIAQQQQQRFGFFGGPMWNTTW